MAPKSATKYALHRTDTLQRNRNLKERNAKNGQLCRVLIQKGHRSNSTNSPMPLSSLYLFQIIEKLADNPGQAVVKNSKEETVNAYALATISRIYGIFDNTLVVVLIIKLGRQRSDAASPPRAHQRLYSDIMNCKRYFRASFRSMFVRRMQRR
jgi:hypothetical protein